MKSASIRSLLLAAAIAQISNAEEICTSPNNVFTVKIDLFAGELGYYTFEECGEMSNPTIGMEIGETYTFNQGDRSNYYHPMGFAYHPDGAHADKPELEPGVTETAGNTCADDMTCSAPMYFLDDTYLGEYSNLDAVATPTTGTDNFGLDDYEPLFFYPLGDWLERGLFNIQLKFDDEDYDKDLFYFCHIHSLMSGRIKLLKNGNPVNSADEPPLGYEYDTPSTFDQACGTFGLDDWQLPNDQCPDTFICGMSSQDASMQQYSGCINAMNCHMFAGMTVGTKADSNLALFMHGMIPHHQNAVNMAKNLLRTDAVDCDDLLDDEDDKCVMQGMLRDIINTQNAQIQTMRAILDEEGYPETDNCVMDIATSSAVG